MLPYKLCLDLLRQTVYAREGQYYDAMHYRCRVGIVPVELVADDVLARVIYPTNDNQFSKGT